MNEIQKLSRQIVTVYTDDADIEVYWLRVCDSTNENLTTTSGKHSFYEIQHVVHGEITLIEDGSEYTLKSGDYHIILPEKQHQITAFSAQTQKLVFGFKLTPKSNSLKAAVTNPKINGFNQSASYAMALIENADFKSYFFSQIVSLTVQILIYSYFPTVKPDADENIKISRAERQYEQILDSAKQNALNSITVSKLAALNFLSVRQLNRICKTIGGRQPIDILNENKLNKIKSLLCTSKLSRKDIAEACEFSSEAALSRFFSRHEGVTISQFQKDILK